MMGEGEKRLWSVGVVRDLDAAVATIDAYFRARHESRRVGCQENDRALWGVLISTRPDGNEAKRECNVQRGPLGHPYGPLESGSPMFSRHVRLSASTSLEWWGDALAHLELLIVRQDGLCELRQHVARTAPSTGKR